MREIGLNIENQTAKAVQEVIEREIRRREAARNLQDTADQLRVLSDDMKLTSEEIDDAARQARANGS